MNKKENDPAIAGSLVKFLLLAEMIDVGKDVGKIIGALSASVLTGADTSNFLTSVKTFVIAVPFEPIGIGICSWFYDFSKKLDQ